MSHVSPVDECYLTIIDDDGTEFINMGLHPPANCVETSILLSKVINFYLENAELAEPKTSEHEYARVKRFWGETQLGSKPTERRQTGHVAPRVGKPKRGLHPGTSSLQDTLKPAWLPRVSEPPVRPRNLQWRFRPPQATV